MSNIILTTGPDGMWIWYPSRAEWEWVPMPWTPR